MGSNEKYLTYRGDVNAVAGHQAAVFFVTVHPDKQPTALYRLDAETFALDEQPLPAGGTCLALETDAKDNAILWVGDTTGQLFRATGQGKKPSAVGEAVGFAVTSLALLSEDRIALLAASQIHVLSRKDGNPLQTLELPEAGTKLAADPSGQWLAAGTSKGTLLVFECEDKPEFLLSESEKLHEAAVTALLFEPEELRFFSAGADQKLLLTHARGTLEPEDRGRSANHSEPVTAMVLAPDERFFTGSQDRTIKSWTRAGASRPATMKDDVGQVIDLVLINVHARPHLMAACDDNTLRFFLVDAGGKIGELRHRAHDAYARAEQQLRETDSARREAALKELAGHADTRSLDLLAKQIKDDADHALRQLATSLVAQSGHPRAVGILEGCLKHDDYAVRRTAFAALRQLTDESDFRPLDLALDSNKADVGTLAVAALEKLAKKDDRALARLEKAINRQSREVRRAALMSLEAVHPNDSPEADLIGLKSQHADLRRLALVRLFQRGLLDQPRVQSALRRLSEDQQADVRRTAFLVSLFTRAKLVEALRARDKELHRQLFELETFTLEDEQSQPAKEAKEKEKPADKPTEPEPPRTRKTKLVLAPADFEPLLQAMASRVLDTCLLGGRCLALLGDPRALGLLLQLSREDNVPARVEVCKALASLNDQRAADRLRTLLDDAAGEVRDAAFTALTQLRDGEPLEAASAGLNASQEDVHRRGLQELLGVSRAKSSKETEAAVRRLLVRALNDRYPSVRGEAFKACLNQQVAGGGADTLRFVLQSIHPDVRRDALTEVMAQIKAPWGEELLFDFYNDPDPALRKEAFEFAVKRAKGGELEPLTRGLTSKYADVRLASVRELVKKHTKQARNELVPAINDADLDVRQAALTALVHADAEDVLTQAMSNQHLDVRLRAAGARARQGDPQSLKPLLALATEPEPTEKERVKTWLLVVQEALQSLGELGDPTALEDVLPLLDSKQPGLRQSAAKALVGLARPELADTFKPPLQHADAEVKYRAALALAFCGDALGASLIFSEAGGKVLFDIEQLAAAVTLGPAGQDRLVAFLDAKEEAIRWSALVILLAGDLTTHDGTPARCLAGLSSRHPRIRLIAASALERFPDPPAFEAFLVKSINDRGDEAAWTIPPETVRAVADLLAFAPLHLRAATVQRLLLLKEEKQHAWDLAWAAFAARYQQEIQSARQQAAQYKLPKIRATREELLELAFGTYVGLVREAGGSHAQNVRIRQTALRRLQTLSQEQKTFQSSALPVLIQTLGDPHQAVRFQAFDQLREQGMPAEQLGAEAIETGHTDLGVKGLNLITEGATPAAGRKVLEDVMRSRTDDLALEAAKILRANHDPVEVAGLALEATLEKLRSQAVNWLAADFNPAATGKKEKSLSDKARKRLVEALESRYHPVRKAAAFELARKKDAAAYDALVELLNTARGLGDFLALVPPLETLGDPRSPEALLDRVENDPAGNAPATELIKAAGRFRQQETAKRLLAMMEKPKQRQAAYEAIYIISGHDQPNVELTRWIIKDVIRGWIFGPQPEREERLDPDGEKKQYPRHDDVLAQLMEKCLDLGEAGLIKNVMDDARWSRGPEVHSVLAVLAVHSDDKLRHEAVEALGWRLKHRKGPVEPLLKALEHRDPITKFLAAEGLAKAGRNDGLTVLLSAVDLMDDIYLRQRAVLALGVLADSRALDVLLRLANEDGHALQELAAEALGHLGQSDKADEIFKLLERLAKKQGGLAQSALRGLSWFNTQAGWRLIRERAQETTFAWRETAVELLSENNEPATRDLILKLLREEDDLRDEALLAARKLFGSDSLEPSYAILQNDEFWIDGPEDQRILDQVCAQGDAARIMEIFPKVKEEHQQPLSAALLKRETLPIEEAAQALASHQPGPVELAAHVLGRAGTAAKSHAAAVESALNAWRKKWEERRREPKPTWGEHPVEETTGCLSRLIWAAGRLGVGQAELIDAATSRGDDSYFRPVRLEAVRALATGKANKQVLDVLEQAAVGHDPEVRVIAAQAVAEQNPKRAVALSERMLSDRVSLERLQLAEGVDLTPAMHLAAQTVHYQGVALPVLISEKDFDQLKAVAQNRDLPEVARLGAIESLAQLATKTAEDELATIGKNTDEDEDLRKAAWRARRRSLRTRTQSAG